MQRMKVKRTKKGYNDKARYAMNCSGYWTAEENKATYFSENEANEIVKRGNRANNSYKYEVIE